MAATFPDYLVILKISVFVYLLSEMTIANFILFYILLLGSINQQIKIERLIGRKMKREIYKW